MTEGKRQLGSIAVSNMSPAQIAEARRAGRLGELLAGRDPDRPGESFTPPEDAAEQGARGKTFRSSRDWLRSLSAEQVNALRRGGHLDALLRGEEQ